MAKNIEVKARVDDFLGLKKKVELIVGTDPLIIEQDDTFFECARGRYKLRELSDGCGELIFYKRPNVTGPKESFYQIYRTHDPQVLRENLTLAFGQVGRVRKRRFLYMIGRTRVHLDQVEGLGSFMELEVVMKQDEDTSIGLKEAADIRVLLGINEEDLLDVAYVDLLLRCTTDSNT